ncbi:lipoate--protein ligase [Liquorilactobacillus capillatus]|uniref:lipoate--protein ligase n=1 Tax=Liquorilactobacillus capillatus DSM 19910 TaxID=1423731 RepID=A0A0R1MC65_9LACO|nr:lipoate protein ligase C-terminal domain-containing protein [Liquorilactobacillus capillatus]KRL01747.1 lipoate--protein ligase [Liquorilactobacillus capillatus DSM 19910]
MITIPVSSHDAAQIFALEYYLMTEKKFTDTIFMLWSTTPTVMLGKYQDAASEVNLSYVKDHKIKIVRRRSGGGTIYTDEGGCQFTFIQPTTEKVIDFSTGMNLIVTALAQLGISVTIDGRNDLLAKGRKVSGNAQYLEGNYRLHHGSLLFNTDQASMARVLQVDPLKLASKGIASVRQRTGNLQQQRPDWSATIFRRYLKQTILEMIPHSIYHLTSADKTCVSKIKQRKFKSPFTNKPFSDQFSCSKKKYLKGVGLLQLSFTVKEQRLTAIKLTGDFFSTLEPKSFSTALVGTTFKPYPVFQALSQVLTATPIMGLTAETLTALIFEQQDN